MLKQRVLSPTKAIFPAPKYCQGSGFLFLSFFLLVLRIESRASGLPSEHFTAELQPQQGGVSPLSCLLARPSSPPPPRPRTGQKNQL